MTKPDTGFSDGPTPMSDAGFARRTALLALALLGLLFFVPFGAGMITGFLEASGGGSRHNVMLLVIVLIWAAGIAALAAMAVKYRPRSSDGPVADSVKRSRRILFGASVMGMFIAALLLASRVEAEAFLSNAPIPVFAALVILAAWLVIAPIGTLLWWRTTDEHDRAAYTDGANVAGHVYMFVAPGWWIATRAGLLPPQDPMIVLGIVAVIWTAVWLYRKYF